MGRTRNLLAFLSALILMALAACGGTTTTTTAPTNAPAAPVAEQATVAPAAEGAASADLSGTITVLTNRTDIVDTSLIIASLVAIVPLLVVFIASFKTGEEFRNTGPFELPQNWLNFENYFAAFTRGRMLNGFLNTSIILVVSVVGTILIGTMAAYVLSRFEFKFKKTVVFLFLLASLVPGVTTQVATFQVVNSLGLFNSRWAAILLFMGTDIISIYIFLQFLEGIPVELDEAALMEGASYFTVYRSVIFPLLYPAIATVVIIKGVAIYNEFYIPFLYMPKTSLGVISTALFRFKGPFIAQWEVISAGIVLAIIPSLVAFLALQKYIYNGLTQGAVKS